MRPNSNYVPHRLHRHRRGGTEVKRFFDRVFRFLEVESKKQTKINRLFFCLIVGWIGFGFIINMVSQLVYYFITVPSYQQMQQSVFFQAETSWLSKIPDIPAPLFVVLFLTAVTLFTAMARYIVRLHKESKEMAQAFLPILSEIKTTLSFLRGRE